MLPHTNFEGDEPVFPAKRNTAILSTPPKVRASQGKRSQPLFTEEPISNPGSMSLKSEKSSTSSMKYRNQKNGGADGVTTDLAVMNYLKPEQVREVLYSPTPNESPNASRTLKTDGKDGGGSEGLKGKSKFARLKANLRNRVLKICEGKDAHDVPEEHFYEMGLEDAPVSLRDSHRARRPRSPKSIEKDMNVLHSALEHPPMSPEKWSKKSKKAKVAFHTSWAENETQSKGFRSNTIKMMKKHQAGGSSEGGGVKFQKEASEKGTGSMKNGAPTFGDGRSLKNFVKCRILAMSAFVHKDPAELDPHHNQNNSRSVNRLSANMRSSLNLKGRDSEIGSGSASSAENSRSANMHQRKCVAFGHDVKEEKEIVKTAINDMNKKRGTIMQNMGIGAVERRRTTVIGAQIQGMGGGGGGTDRRKSMAPGMKSMAGRRSTFKRMTVNQQQEKDLLEEEEEEVQEEEKNHPIYNLTQLARDLNLPLEEVQRLKEQFESFDTDKSGDVSVAEFSLLLARLAQVDDSKALPQEMLRMHWREVDLDGSGDITFPEFAKWYSAHGFNEEMLLEPNERMVRNIARKHGFPLIEVERMKKQFDMYDEDGSGEIEMAEFEMLLYRLLRVPRNEELPPNRVRQFWQEIDQDRSGQVDFEEFLCWYTRYFNLDGSTAVSPIEEFYKSIRFPRRAMW